MALVTGTTDFSGMKNADVVIEAVFEDLELKKKVVRDVEDAVHLLRRFAFGAVCHRQHLIEDEHAPRPLIGRSTRRERDWSDRMLHVLIGRWRWRCFALVQRCAGDQHRQGERQTNSTNATHAQRFRLSSKRHF